MIDVTELTDEELEQVVELSTTERQRRITLASAADQMDRLTRNYLGASGIEEGEPWRQPTGAHDAYPIHFIVSHNGANWASTVSVNIWEPGVSGWREQGDGNVVPLWVQPTGAHDAYQTGDRVRHNGDVWVSNSDNNVWEPGVHGWDVEVSE